MTKWYWPTWADWLAAYGHEVVNLAYTGFGINHQEWILHDIYSQIGPQDHVVVMWPQNHRIMQWYDREWIDQHDCQGFFPECQGRLWFTQDVLWQGLYRTRPELGHSLTHMIVQGFATILNVQKILQSIGCQITMAFAQNPWLDGRPTYVPKFATRWQELNQISGKEIDFARQLCKLRPFRSVLEQIDWDCFVDAPKNPQDVNEYSGIWEYYLSDRNYVIHKHPKDNHPPPIVHHDWAVKHLLQIDPKTAKHSALALELTDLSHSIEIPAWSDHDAVADPRESMLHASFQSIINEKHYQEILQ